MSDLNLLDDDFLDGCLSEIDFDEEPDEISTLRPLFPDGNPSIADEWDELFNEDDLDELNRRFNSVILEKLRTAPYGYSGWGRDLGIADRLRSMGLKVVEIQGWQTRGSATFHPKGSVDHHTASGKGRNAPALNICINGRSDLPGPLCHVLIARDNTCYVIASGRANHAGSGGYWGISGNSNVYGVEHENTGTGTEPWREDQRVTAAKVHAALLQGILPGYRRVCQHKEWTSRKIDKWGQSGADMRSRVSNILNFAPIKPEPEFPLREDDDIMDISVARIVKGTTTGAWYVTDGITKQWIDGREHAAILISNFAVDASSGSGKMDKQSLDAIQPYVWPQKAVDSIRLVGTKPPG